MSGDITVTIKPAAGGNRFNVVVKSSLSVAEVKEEVAKQSGIGPTEQRLIFKGQILKDDRTVESYGIVNESVLHMVRKLPQQGSNQTPAPAAPAAAPVASGVSPLAGLFGSGGGAGGDRGLSDMLNSPMVQSLMNSPEFLQTLISGNPAIREIMERNPEVGHALNNPEVLREYMQLASNPNLMQEHLRNTDRAMSNLESIPGGFNALRQIYENVQEPLMNATAGSGAQANPFAAIFNPPGAANASNEGSETRDANPASGTPNSAPLPNPWAPPPTTQQSNTGTATGTAATGAPLPGIPAMPPNMNSAMMEAMQNPQFQQMMQSVLSSPGMMENIMSAMPEMGQTMQNNPQLREAMSNPETLRSLLDPQNMQALMQIQQAMQQLQGSGLGGMFGGPGERPGGGTNPVDPGAGLAALLGGMGNLGAMGPPPVSDPESAYASQLQQLQDMGFIDRQANIRALQATGGNVNAAVERLLSSG